MDKEKIKNELSQQLDQFNGLKIEECRKDIKEVISSYVSENLKIDFDEPFYFTNNITSEKGIKNDKVRFKCTLNPKYHDIFMGVYHNG